MGVEFRKIPPERIEEESFRIIQKELGPHDFSEKQLAVARRMIHAAGDMEIASIIKFNPASGDDAVDAGIDAIRAGKKIVVDVNMALQGITKRLLNRFGSSAVCRIGDSEVADMAAAEGITRAEAAMIVSARRDNPGIVAIGNAPTALIRLVSMVKAGEFRPDLIIGVPVGFVNAAESKEYLQQELPDIPYITVQGRKGGTPMAVAAINALLRLADIRS